MVNCTVNDEEKLLQFRGINISTNSILMRDNKSGETLEMRAINLLPMCHPRRL